MGTVSRFVDFFCEQWTNEYNAKKNKNECGFASAVITNLLIEICKIMRNIKFDLIFQLFFKIPHSRSTLAAHKYTTASAYQRISTFDMGQKNLFSLAVITFVSTLTVAQNPDGVADHSSIAKGFDEVLNPDLLAKVTSELLMFADLGDIHNPNTNLKHGKKSTNFVDLGAVPRNYVELAVQEFFDYAFPESFYDENYQIKHNGQREVYTRADIKGAEWWLQKRSGKEGIGFHYDKDEAFASIHMRMKYPIVGE